jgi:hypothetical protein
MRTVILPALVLAFALDAGTQRRHVRAYYHQNGVAHRYRNDDTLAGYYEHRLDAVPSARSGGGIYTTSSTADVVADKHSTVMGPRYAAPRHQSFGRDLPHL